MRPEQQGLEEQEPGTAAVPQPLAAAPGPALAPALHTALTTPCTDTLLSQSKLSRRRR